MQRRTRCNRTPLTMWVCARASGLAHAECHALNISCSECKGKIRLLPRVASDAPPRSPWKDLPCFSHGTQVESCGPLTHIQSLTLTLFSYLARIIELALVPGVALRSLHRASFITRAHRAPRLIRMPYCR